MSLKLLVKGFKPIERQLLNGVVKLSHRREPRLELVSEADGETADVVMIDTSDPQAVEWAASQAWLERKAVIWVDASTASSGHIVVKRPIQWPTLLVLLLRAMEEGPQKIIDAPAAAVNRSVLVVDDSLAVRAYLRSLLESRGFAVTDADSGEAGIEAAAAAPHACILMDVMMPGIDGFEACRRIKASQASAPAVVMLTGQVSPFNRIRGKMAGCDAYLTKPVDPDQLHEVLLRYVAAPHAGTQAATPAQPLATRSRTRLLTVVPPSAPLLYQPTLFKGTSNDPHYFDR
jgi:two-component system cell cycle response regulator